MRKVVRCPRLARGSITLEATNAARICLALPRRRRSRRRGNAKKWCGNVRCSEERNYHPDKQGCILTSGAFMFANECKINQFLLGYSRLMTADIADERMADQPCPGVNHPAW